MSARPRILFVDDEVRVLNALRRDLREGARDWDMDFVDSPEDALRRLDDTRIDLAVLDMQMPGMSGVQLAKALAAADSDIVCLMLTGAEDLQVAVQAVNEAGIFRFYTKPCSTADLVQGITDGLACRRDRRSGSTASGGADVGLAALEKLPIGVMVLDAAGKLVFANARAGEMLSAGDGITVSPDGTCRAATKTDSKALRRHIDTVLTDASVPEAMLALTRKSLLRPLSAIVTALDNAEQPSVLLFLTDPESQGRPSLPALRSLFGLTRSEAKLVQGLVAGLRLEEAADDMGVTLSSARTYLKQVFGKTDVNRQADLVRLVLSSGLPFTESAAADFRDDS